MIKGIPCILKFPAQPIYIDIYIYISNNQGKRRFNQADSNDFHDYHRLYKKHTNNTIKNKRFIHFKKSYLYLIYIIIETIYI